MLVDDDAMARDRLAKGLAAKARTLVVAFASTEEQAREWLAARPGAADLVVVSLFLAEGGGLGVLAAARRDPRHPPVVALAPSADAGIRSHCLALGAQAVFDRALGLDAFYRHVAAMPALGTGGPPGAG